MYCLWNGEYGEHDLSFVPALETTTRIQNEQYEHYVGTIVGDFTCLKAEYDWGRRDQRWTIKCNLCGKISYQYHTKDWRRGKGRTLLCDCRKEAVEREKKSKREKAKEERKRDIDSEIGKIYGKWEVVEYAGFVNCKVKCIECGKTRNKVRLSDIKDGTARQCTHRKISDYSSEEWIGVKIGNLTTIGRSGHDFIARCDCGNEIVVGSTAFFKYKSKRNCGKDGCKYYEESKAESVREKGIAYEKEIYDMLIKNGYEAKRTPNGSDYGVDIIVKLNTGEKMAIQCKNNSNQTGVDALQEVYAGGRFYDCTRFCVISKTEFSRNAYWMAQKLGIYLCNGEFDPPNCVDSGAKEIIPTFKRRKELKLYEINGVKKTLPDWCLQYGVQDIKRVKRLVVSDGVSLEEALKSKSGRKTYTIRGFTGNVSEICRHYGISNQLVRYRMENCNMNLEEAIFAPKHTKKRKQPATSPSKQVAPLNDISNDMQLDITTYMEQNQV